MNPDKDISLKHRLFNVVFLVGMFMSFSCSLMNYFLGAATAAILLSFLWRYHRGILHSFQKDKEL